MLKIDTCTIVLHTYDKGRERAYERTYRSVGMACLILSQIMNDSISNINNLFMQADTSMYIQHKEETVSLFNIPKYFINGLNQPSKCIELDLGKGKFIQIYISYTHKRGEG